MSLEDACREGARLGLKGIDLADRKDWPRSKIWAHPTMMGPAGHTLNEGINRRKPIPKSRGRSAKCSTRWPPGALPTSSRSPATAAACPMKRVSENCAAFLNRVKAQAEDKGVTICLELLNSKVDHPDYQCDHTAWGVEVMKRVNSPRVKLLFDIYHMEIMEGDIIRTIRAELPVHRPLPHRRQSRQARDRSTQELNYRAVAQAIVDLGFRAIWRTNTARCGIR